MVGQGDGGETFRLHGQGAKGKGDRNRIAMTWKERDSDLRAAREKSSSNVGGKGKWPYWELGLGAVAAHKVPGQQR